MYESEIETDMPFKIEFSVNDYGRGAEVEIECISLFGENLSPLQEKRFIKAYGEKDLKQYLLDDAEKQNKESERWRKTA